MSVRVHGQSGPAHAPPRSSGASPHESSFDAQAWQTEESWAAHSKELAAQTGRNAAAALQANEPVAAISLFTAALRTLGACGEAAGAAVKGGVTFEELYRGRAAAHAALGDADRAEEDMADAREAACER